MTVAIIQQVETGFKELLRKVEEGESISVTRNGEIVAEINPPTGKRTWPDFMKRLEQIYPEGPVGKPASEIIDDGRGPRT